MVNDPIGDFIIQIKNAGMIQKEIINVPYSKLKHAVADKLVDAGFIESAEKFGKQVKKVLKIKLKYGENGTHHIMGVKRVSKPGRRLYLGVDQIFPVKFGKGKRILSTPAGILTGEEAKEKNVGGEDLFIIW